MGVIFTLVLLLLTLFLTTLIGIQNILLIFKIIITFFALCYVVLSLLDVSENIISKTRFFRNIIISLIFSVVIWFVPNIVLKNPNPTILILGFLIIPLGLSLVIVFQD